MGANPMPMPYALCPMPYEHLMLLRKAIYSERDARTIVKTKLTQKTQKQPGLSKKPGC
jgi:hypothetical protein